MGSTGPAGPAGDLAFELAEKYRKQTLPLSLFVHEMKNKAPTRVPGTAVFMHGGDATPPALLHNLKHNKVLHERVFLLKVETLEIPYQVGDSVQVMDGPFTEWVGVINEINHDKGKLKVMISIFGSETPVELDFLQVKPV